jgi:thioredoxin reductase
MIVDCAVIGGGPAGLNAALVLGRSRRRTILFDDNKPRNAVTSESHGFITRDGIDPQEFKRIAQEELSRYPDVNIEKQRVHRLTKDSGLFQVEAENGEVFTAKNIILATGFKEVLPEIPRVKEFYGKSLFSCPFCDGWELRDRPLAVIADDHKAFHMAKVVSNWTNDLIVFTNGSKVLSLEEQELLKSKGIRINEKKIASFIGEEGLLEKIQLEDETEVYREGGFIAAEWKQAASFDSSLEYTVNEQGGIETDSWQRTSVEGVFACGDTRIAGPSQLIIAAGEGSMAALAVNAALIEEKFSQENQLRKKGESI